MIKEVYRAVKERQNLLVALGLMLSLCGAVLFDATAKAVSAMPPSIPVAIEAEGISEVFEVVLTPQQEKEQVQKLYLTHGTQKSFVLTFTKDDVGEHYYTLTQTKGTDQTITYDESVYHVYIKVTDEGGSLKAVTTLWKDGTDTKLSKAAFQNQKDDTGEEPSGGSTGGDGTGEDGNNGGTGEDGSSGGNDSNGGNVGGNDPDGTGNGGSSNGTGSGSGNDTGNGSDGDTANGSGSFWGNGSFWGSSTGTTNGTSFWSSAFVRTGDSAKVLRWVIFLLAALAVAAGAWRYQRNQEHETNRKDREDG